MAADDASGEYHYRKPLGSIPHLTSASGEAKESAPPIQKEGAAKGFPTRSRPPESGMEQHQHSEQLQTTQQHAESEEPLRGIGQAREIAGRPDHLAQAGTDIGDDRRRTQARKKVQAESAKSRRPQSYADKK